MARLAAVCDPGAGSAPAVPVLCLLPPGSDERRVILAAIESIEEGAVFSAIRGPQFDLLGGGHGRPDAASGAVVIGELAQLSSMAGGAVPPAAFIPVLDPIREGSRAIARLLVEDPAVVWPLERPLDVVSVRAALRHARRWVRLSGSVRSVGQTLARREEAHRDLFLHASALAAESDPDRLVGRILALFREDSGAEAGEVYLVETAVDGSRSLALRRAENSIVDPPLAGLRLPLDGRTPAGHAAITGETLNIVDLYDLPPWVGYSFNRAFDRETGFRSRTALVLPLTGAAGAAVGVVQLVNRKGASGHPAPFDEAAVERLQRLAGLAAPCLERLREREAFQRTFDGVVAMLVRLIESGDPGRAGHSERVARYAVTLADAVTRQENGPLAQVTFDAAEVKEIEIAAKLHEIGLAPGTNVASSGNLRDGGDPPGHVQVAKGLEYLSSVPWPQGLQGVPAIAYLIHERLDGSGLPRGVRAPEIPLAARILSLCDRFDTLTAACATAQRAVSPERALAILHAEGRSGKIDANLVAVFIEARVWRRAGAHADAASLKGSRH